MGGLAILVGAFGLLNLLRGRPFSSLPENVGPAELAGFVLVPAALPLIFGGQWVSALVTAGANLLVLAIAFGLIRYGVLSILRWTGPRVIDQLDASVSVYPTSTMTRWWPSRAKRLSGTVTAVTGESGMPG